jgi:exonuclease III
LLGVDRSVFDIVAIDEGDFYVKFTLRYKSADFKFVLYSIYGPAQSQNKGAFLAELANTCSKENLPFLIGGDFNIMRKPEDKAVEILILNGHPFLMLSLSHLILGKLS